MWKRKFQVALSAATLLAGTPLAASAAISVTYTSDSQGRVHTAVYVNGAATRTVTYTYDAAGNRSSVVAN